VINELINDIEDKLRNNEYNDYQTFKDDFLSIKKQFVDES